MFWKKKKKIFELGIEGDDKDHRTAFRLKPDVKHPVTLNVSGNSYPLQDISGTGCSFQSQSFRDGARGPGTISIPSEDVIFPVTIRVVGTVRGICHCEFSKISEKAEDVIHAYILEMQKERIRNK